MGARSSGVQILLQHVLGDVISPPLIGMISDATNSLQAGLQLVWVAFLVSGLFWWIAYQFLPPLPVSARRSASKGTSSSSASSVTTSEDRDSQEEEELTPALVVAAMEVALDVATPRPRE